MSFSFNWVQSLRAWSMSTAAWGRVTRPCSSSLSVFLSRLHVLQSWCRPASVPRRLASLLDYRRPGCKFRHSTGPLPSCLQENHYVRQIWPRCSQRIGTWANEKRKSQGSTSNPKHPPSMPRSDFFTIPRTRICLSTFYAAIPFHTTSNSSTCWTVSLPMMRQTSHSAATCWKRWQKAPRPSEFSVMIPTSSFSWCTGHQGCELSPRFKWKSGIAMSWTSTNLFSS